MITIATTIPAAYEVWSMIEPTTGGPMRPPIAALVYSAPRIAPRPTVPNSPAVTAGARAMNPP